MKKRISDPYPLGASKVEDGFTFAVYSKNPVEALVVAPYDDPENISRIELNENEHKTGDIWHLFLETKHEKLLYGYSVQYGDRQIIAQDPYAKLLYTPDGWQKKKYTDKPLGVAFLSPPFDWEKTNRAEIEQKDIIIYEMHLAGFTKELPGGGTFSSCAEKIGYLKELGINMVEFLPLFEFNEYDCVQINPHTKETLYNFWGYSPLNFFCPMMRYAESDDPIAAHTELKKMIRAFHKEDIGVIVDVVFNHTGEGNEHGPAISWKALAEDTYYLKNGDGHFLNYSGCGNTFNSNNPIVQDQIIDSLRYWATEYQIDGFRFDLASCLTRGQDGSVLETAPLIERISQDPILSHLVLIAEPWDAAGLHQVGQFYQSPWQEPDCWMEWNDHFRSVVRNFIKGTPGLAAAFATKITGSQDIYGHGGSPENNLHFITCHDGFTLRDLVSYNEKHNEENGEDNRDGCNHNESWNCGHEGQTDDPAIMALRNRQIKNFMVALFVSNGPVMLLMGDEYGHTKNGNNNTWCQSGPANWFLWDEAKKNSDLVDFCKKLIALRKNSKAFSIGEFFTADALLWHDEKGNSHSWCTTSQFVAFSTKMVYVAFNAKAKKEHVVLPEGLWKLTVNADDGKKEGEVVSEVEMAPYSSIICFKVEKK